jgi:hypothetical protein
MPNQPFKSDYVTGPETILTESVQQSSGVVETAQTGGGETAIKELGGTPEVGKPWGTEKPRRIKIRGKISK